MRLLQGDCLELIKDIPDKSIDLIIIDPPYDMKAHGGGGAFGSDNREFFNELEKAKITKGFNVKVLDEFVRVLKKINIYIWCNAAMLRMYINYFEDLGCTTELICWHKTNPVPTCSNKYLSDTEYLLFFRESGVKVYGDYHSKKKYYVTPTNKADKKLYNHPTIKPQNIIENLIINSSLENDVVLDAFMGSGTTGAACVNTNRDFIGIELDENYFNVAKERIEAA